jgi:hypothetical protein
MLIMVRFSHKGKWQTISSAKSKRPASCKNAVDDSDEITNKSSASQHIMIQTQLMAPKGHSLDEMRGADKRLFFPSFNFF